MKPLWHPILALRDSERRCCVRTRDAASIMFVAVGILTGMYAVVIIQTLLLVFVMSFGQPFAFRLVATAASALTMAALLWLGFQLIRHHSKYAELLFPAPHDGPSTVGRRDVVVIGVTLIGVYLTVTAVPQLAKWVGITAARLAMSLIERSVITGVDPQRIFDLPYPAGELVSSLVQVTIGIVMVVYPRRIARRLDPETRAEPIAPEPPPKNACPGCGHPYDPADSKQEAEAFRCSKCKRDLPRANV